MAGSQYAYVRGFEAPDALLPDTFIVVRVDGRGFHRFSEEHGYARPCDARGLGVMNAAAAAVMAEWGEAVLAFGESDEYSFVFGRRASTFGRRASKLASCVASLFASAFVLAWPRHFPATPLRRAPSFDARAVAYPTLRSVVDYVKWRAVDTHVNGLYNAAFAALVDRGGATTTAAHARLKGTLAAEKHELLRGEFGVNYAALPAAYRRGTTLLRVPRGAALPPGGGAWGRGGAGIDGDEAGGGGGVGQGGGSDGGQGGGSGSGKGGRHCPCCSRGSACPGLLEEGSGGAVGVAPSAEAGAAAVAPASAVEVEGVDDAAPSERGERARRGGPGIDLGGATEPPPEPPLGLPATVLVCHADLIAGAGAQWLVAFLGRDEEAAT